MTALRHASYGVLFRFVVYVDLVGLYLPMAKGLVLTESFLCRIVHAASWASMLFCRCCLHNNCASRVVCGLLELKV